MSCKNCTNCTDCFCCEDCNDCDRCVRCKSCDSCRDCHDCIECIGLENEQYCIRNVQFTEDEFYKFSAILEPYGEFRKKIGGM